MIESVHGEGDVLLNNDAYAMLRIGNLFWRLQDVAAGGPFAIQYRSRSLSAQAGPSGEKHGH